MQRFKNLSISRQLKLVTTLTCAFTILVTCSAFLLFEWNSFRQEQLENLTILATVIGDNCTAAIRFNDQSATEEALGALRAHPNVVEACVFTASGTPFGRYPSDLAEKRVSMPVFQARGFRFGSDRIELFQPVYMDKKLIGTVFIASNLDNYYRQMRTYVWITGLVMLGSTLAAFFIASIVFGFLSKPILSLAQTAQNVTDTKNYALRANVGENIGGEIGLLSSCFNEMLGKIQSEISGRQAAQAVGNRLAIAFEQAAEIILITDPEGKIQYVNPAFERVTGHTSADSLGKTPGFLKSGKQNAAFYMDLWKTLHDGKVWAGHFVDKTKSGTLFDADSTISPVRDVDGKLIHYVAVMRDVSKEIHLKKQLMQAQKVEAIGTLAGGVAHDFNNILGAILGFADLARMDAAPGSQIEQCLDEIVVAGCRAKDLVRQILTFGRQVDQAKQPVHLHRVVKEAMNFLRATMPPTIEIRTDTISKNDVILGDRTCLHQILINLATNAGYAMKETGGVLDIRIRGMDFDADRALTVPGFKPGSYVCLTIGDNGPGIPREVLARIFDPFFTTKPIGEGTGLGLSVVHGIVQEHGGAVQVETEPGKGTSFHVFFPRSELIPIEDEPLPKAISPSHKSSGRILIVDDEVPLQVYGKKVLEKIGYQVTTCSTGKNGLEAFSQDPAAFDLIISDFAMPTMNGIELIEQIRKIRSSVPIILWTGYSEKVGAENIRKFDIQQLLMKPVSVSVLMNAVNDVLKQTNQSQSPVVAEKSPDPV